MTRSSDCEKIEGSGHRKTQKAPGIVKLSSRFEEFDRRDRFWVLKVKQLASWCRLDPIEVRSKREGLVQVDDWRVGEKGQLACGNSKISPVRE